jgi:uncharacterized protein
MSDYYSKAQRDLQDKFDTRRLADLIAGQLIHAELRPQEVQFISNSDMVFVSTVNKDGQPTVSYKGGDIGFIKVIDTSTLIFPIYDGNGTFYTTGNVAEEQKIGLLFIDLERPNRMRIHGTADLIFDGPLLESYHEAQFLIRVRIAEIYPNCPRYVHKYQRVTKSKFVPDPDKETPVPGWKRIDAVQHALPAHQQGRAEERGGQITMEQYAALLENGET